MEMRKALTDKKEYKILNFDNGLEVLLISDPSKPYIPREDEAEYESQDDSEEEGSDASEDDLEESDDSESLHSHGHVKASGLCAVAMAVGTGSFDEEKEDPHGLAHLLEHMLFMGSTKFPIENTYDEHISKHGGFSNAFTETEHTVYCKSKYFLARTMILTSIGHFLLQSMIFPYPALSSV